MKKYIDLINLHLNIHRFSCKKNRALRTYDWAPEISFFNVEHQSVGRQISAIKKSWSHGWYLTARRTVSENYMSRNWITSSRWISTATVVDWTVQEPGTSPLRNATICWNLITSFTSLLRIPSVRITLRKSSFTPCLATLFQSFTEELTIAGRIYKLKNKSSLTENQSSVGSLHPIHT